MLWPWRPNLLHSYGLDTLGFEASQGCCSIPEDKAGKCESEAGTEEEGERGEEVEEEGTGWDDRNKDLTEEEEEESEVEATAVEEKESGTEIEV